ncbi:MAG: hypothetical protein DRJ61_11795 [Acidobacteria bacterium]|nr:MAG: hypothetical protein DRJ61_11795 [Acidobacteriota bacterium]
MPGRNRTGPLGQGAMSGRGLGDCRGTAAQNEAPTFGRGRGMGGGGGMGRGQGLGRGFGRGLAGQIVDDVSAGQNQAELEREIEELKKRLEAVEK